MYVFSHASLLGWFDGAQLVRGTFERGYHRFWHPDGGYVFTITPKGDISDATRYAYEQAFALLGYAWFYRLTADPRAITLAEELWAWLLGRLGRKERGGFALAAPASGSLSQNPHMHLLEACLNWYEASGDAVWLGRAGKLFALFENHFFDAENRVLREFFTNDWRAQGVDAERIYPGHQVEWIWLINRYGALSGNQITKYTPALYEFATRLGRNSTTGLLYEEVNPKGRLITSGSRLWSQTELLKAQVVLYEHDPSASAAEQIKRTVDNIFTYHIDPAGAGLWMDEVDATGKGVSRDVPASTFYHLFLAFVEVNRICNIP